MIFLIDDNRYEQQKKLYHADYLFDSTFEAFLQTIYKIRIVDYKKMAKELEQADVILLHHTFADADESGAYLDNSRRIRDFIVDDIAEEEAIPYVLFSGSISETTFDNDDEPTVITGMNKNLFYENLFPFLQYYKETNRVELKILAYGSEYKIHDAIQLVEMIIESLQKKDNFALFEVKYINLETFTKFYTLSKSKKSLDEFFDELKKSSLTVGDFIKKLKKIKKSLFTYGENIYD